MNVNRNNQIGPAKFGTAVHALIWLAQSGGTLSSATIAGQVKSHAAFLRRVLALLAHSGIVEAKEGRDGGYCLKRCPDEITLADVFLAVKAECAETKINLECDDVSERLDARLEEIMGEVEAHTINLLKRFTIADMTADINLKS